MNSKGSHAGWYFLGIMVLVYFIFGCFALSKILEALALAYGVLKNLIPVFVMIFVLMVLLNYCVTAKMMLNYLGKGAGSKGWILSIAAGIISTGPIYAWYPLLKEIKEQGGSEGYMATFLYSRAVKPALIPLMMFYFGPAYTIIFVIILIPFAIIQGLIVDKLVR
ncbi:MAG: hypothetical protein ACLFUU_03145 [Desulfobacteraceae bacterium]